jgi:hypothetical protein
MLTRRTFYTLILLAPLPKRAACQIDSALDVRIRADETMRAAIPPIVQSSLKVEPDNSPAAKALARRVPKGRALPIIVLITGAIAIPIIIQMIREALRQVYYGGVLIDMRTQPP